jgi:hypothetical protein
MEEPTMNENETRQVPVSEALNIIMRDLGAIPVPIEYLETVAIPIKKSIVNLMNVCMALDKAEQEGQKNEVENETA